MRPHFNAKQHIKSLNAFKREVGTEPIYRAIFMEHFKRLGFPGNSAFFTYLYRGGIVKRDELGFYSFVDNKPIHYQKIQEIHDRYQSINRQRTNKHKIKIATSKAAVEINKAVDFLKQKGFIIFSPEGELFRKL